jgi:steroid delta-isomerase-like uncharacterized protein
MTPEKNEAVVRRIFEEIWNRGALDRIDDLFDPAYVRHNAPPGSPPGLETEKRHRADFRQAFPDLVITADDVISVQDKVVVRYTWRGTYQGTWPGIPGAGTRVTVSGIAIHRLEAGKVKELWVFGDELGLFQQLGVVSLPE